MTNEAKKLLKENPEACKEIATDFGAQIILNGINWERFYKANTKPDWEILEFRGSDGTPITKYPNGLYGRASGSASLEFYLREKHPIHSVRRSDGEVFTVGDKETDNQATIKAFKIINNEMIVSLESNIGGGTMHLKDLTKLKPLFKTEDGKDVYEGDETIPVCKDNYAILSSNKWDGTDTSLLYFSTRSAAEQWVEDNKPRYSIAQLRRAAISVNDEAIVERFISNQKC